MAPMLLKLLLSLLLKLSFSFSVQTFGCLEWDGWESMGIAEFMVHFQDVFSLGDGMIS